MVNEIKIGTYVRVPSGMLCQVYSISSNSRFVKVRSWPEGDYYITWVSVSDLVVVGNE